MSVDLLFRNARVADGCGNPWYRADVAVADGRIAAIGTRLELAARRELDVADQVPAPRFIDINSGLGPAPLRPTASVAP
jgi:N-acyl-D-aspartate/D-glutamate deacylase